MRIEMATSELEGAGTVAWADPGQVVSCVTWAQPRDTFERFIEPRLAGIDHGANGSSGEAPGSVLPHRVRAALDRLRQAHVRLYRENRSGRQPSRTARVVLMLVEDDRVYFIKGIPCWVFLVRDGQAAPACVGPADEADATGLGVSAKLNLAVTSIDVKGNDIVVLIAAPEGQEPDRRAVARVFEQTQDLKRACDGLVNLFRFDAEGAGAAAVRFVPVASSPSTGDFALMEDLERSLRRDLADRVADSVAAREGFAPATDFELPEMDLPTFLREGPPARAPMSPPPQEPAPMPVEPPPPAPETPAREPAAAVQEPAAPARELPRPVTETASVREPAPEHPATLDAEGVQPTAGAHLPAHAFAPKRRRFAKGPWMVAVGAAILAVLAVAGIPEGLRLLRGGTSPGVGGVLRVEPSPPARAIYIDGVDQGTGSPAILEGVGAGAHTVRLDLGAFGVIEERVRIRRGQTTDLAPRATGSLEIVAIDARPGAQAWLGGGSRLSVPCRIDTLPVGWHEIFYEDDHLPLWERSVLVRAGETSRVRINNAFAADRALLKIESWEFRIGEGLRETAGDSAYVDGRFVGRTPYEAEIAPGLHGVRVRGGQGQVWTEIADLSAGSSRVVAPRFGMGGWPSIRHQNPGTVYLRGPVLLTAKIETPDGEPARNPRLHLPELNASVRDVPLAPVGDDGGSFVGMIDPQWVPIDRPVSYYFTVQTTSGQTLCSELYRLRATTTIGQAGGP
jgi:hypothetical protein